MSSSQEQERLRAWCQARVDEAGTVDGARLKDEYTQDAWREVCAHLGVVAKPRKARNLAEALEALRRRVSES